MTGLEVKDPAVFPLKGNAAAENIASLIPAYKNRRVRFGNSERFAVHFLTLKKELPRDVMCNRVARETVHTRDFLSASLQPR